MSVGRLASILEMSSFLRLVLMRRRLGRYMLILHRSTKIIPYRAVNNLLAAFRGNGLSSSSEEPVRYHTRKTQKTRADHSASYVSPTAFNEAKIIVMGTIRVGY